MKREKEYPRNVRLWISGAAIRHGRDDGTRASGGLKEENTLRVNGGGRKVFLFSLGEKTFYMYMPARFQSGIL